MRLAIFLAVCVSFLSGCAVNPVTGERELALVTEGQELAIGREQYLPAKQSQGGEYKVDQSLGRYVSRVGQSVAAVSDRPLPYEFTVLNNATPNAWALPGGKIAINRGLLTELQSEAELAAVLGHEVVHSAARHGAQSMQRGLLFQGLVMATALTAADSDYANYIVGGAQVGAQLLSQKYSRDAELEADYYGTRYLAQAGYNPRAAVSLQETFVELSEGRSSGWLEGLFSSHPPSQARVEANRETARALGMEGRIGEDDYEQALAYLRSKQPAYEAFDEAQKLATKGDLETAMQKVERAIDIEPKEARFYGLKGEILYAQRRYRAAEQEFTSALQRDPRYYDYYLGRGLARARLDNAQAARTDLENSNALLPTALAANELGKLSLAGGQRNQAMEYFQLAMDAPGKLGHQATRNFIELDLPRNPNKYIATRPNLTSSGDFIAIVRNQTNLSLENIEVAFEIVVNGEILRRARQIGALGPGSGKQVPSGLRFSSEQTLEQPKVSIIRASVM